MSKEEFFKKFKGTFDTDQKLEEFSTYVFQALDTDQNGFVDFKELVLGLTIISEGSREDGLRWIFMLYDVNKEGVIKIEEMVEVITAIFNFFGDSEIVTSAEDTASDLFTRMDVDKD